MPTVKHSPAPSTVGCNGSDSDAVAVRRVLLIESLFWFRSHRKGELVLKSSQPFVINVSLMIYANVPYLY